MSSSDEDSAVPQRRGCFKQVAAIAGGLPFAPGLAGGVAAGASLNLVAAPAAAQEPQADSTHRMIARRNFLKFIAASPLVATPTVASVIATLFASTSGEALAQSYDVLRGSRRALGPDGIITAAGDALNVFEFEPAAKKAVLSQGAPAHWGYLESGVDGDLTRDANHTAYQRYNIRVRRLIDARKV